MVFYIAQNGDISYGIYELMVDKRSDIEDIPSYCAPGSSCLVIEDSSVWVRGSDGWHQI